MARAKSPEKHAAILAAAAEEIAAAGIGASTSAMARRAGIAEGTLFTYFPSKDALFNAVYLHLKSAAYAELFRAFPAGASLELRTRHIFTTYLLWMANNPVERRAVEQLKVSDIVTPATRAEAAGDRTEIQTVLEQLSARTGARALAPAYLAALMLSMQDATVDYLAEHPRQRKHYIEASFATFWRAVR